MGRGQSSGVGKTSGRGTKGQNSRAGGRPRPELRDIIKKYPKRRGYGKNRGRTVYTNRPQPFAVSLNAFGIAFKNGDTVSPETLIERGVIKGVTRVPRVKIIGSGDVKVKLTIENCELSSGAKAAIEKAGGKIILESSL